LKLPQGEACLAWSTISDGGEIRLRLKPIVPVIIAAVFLAGAMAMNAAAIPGREIDGSYSNAVG
jgi:hypothetical protein